MLALRRVMEPRPSLHKGGGLLMIEPIEESKHEEEDLEHEENMKDLQSADCTAYDLVSFANSQTMKVEGILKQRPVIILIDIGSTNNFMDSKLMIACDHRIETHHCPVTTADARPQEQDAPTIGARGSLMRSCKSGPRDMELSLEDKTDLKRAGLLGP
ncbi:hypothetical protein BHM03_00019953 [Ensete ventricosum]|nr:hypothetical protein BHM03_00019953 [Ensete ventricosum]